MRVRGPLPSCHPLRATGSAGRAVVLGAVLALLGAACGEPVPPTPPPPDAQTVVATITEDGLRSSLEALAVATEGSDQYRAVGSAGYDAAAELVERELSAAGWTVTADAYDDALFIDEGGSFIEVGGRTYGATDVRPPIFAPSGDVEGRVITLDWALDASADSAKGCAVTHYGSLPPNAIVLVRDGPCLLRERVIAAQKAGAAAFVAVYPEAPADVVYRPTLIEPGLMEIPALVVSREAADALLATAADRATAHLVTHTRTTTAPTRSILAELPGIEPGTVVMLGAHLDSVFEGPGINDDGSGAAALLEIARALGGTRPRATIRLAFWSGEELGLHGSYRYASTLSTDEAQAILVYANADMIASPNGYAGVYDEPGAPAGATAAHDLLTAAVERAGGSPVGVDVGGGSDHYGFDEVGIVTAGVFSGAAEPVSTVQAAASGAIAGRPADPCYHQPCDTLANANVGLARTLAAALADFAVRVANDPELLRR
jgi:Zn-dependent M28 family amino/carboxypeptidase